ncbi:MAG: histidinol-phosphate transaminase [bacterium]
MSRFMKRNLTPYTPGEQPRERKYLKLNTNESPFPPAPAAIARAAEAMASAQLYCDPAMTALREAFAAVYAISPERVTFGNGSDELLNFAFQAFCGKALFPDITYGFYPVFAALNGVPCEEIPLRADFTLAPEDYLGREGTIFLANPNAPTGLALPPEEIARLLEADPERVVVVDEAYVDFGAESCLGLTERYPNLLVIGTFSKSRSLAGARLGYAVGDAGLIGDLETIRYSTNPYNVNRMTQAAGVGVLESEDYTRRNCAAIAENRTCLAAALRELGFAVTDSKANFLFVSHPALPGDGLYRALREKGILVRRWSAPRIRDWTRITIGTRAEMEKLCEAVREVLKS